MMSEKRLVLIDSYALIYRSYFAFMKRPMYNKQGFNTSTIFGFLLTIDDIYRKLKPTHIAAAFDLGGKTFRHEMYEQYKANRQAQPEEIRKSVPFIKEILQAMNIHILEAEGYEADDVIGTMAKLASAKDFETFMVTPDKDYCQLVCDKIKIYKPQRSGNDAEILDVEAVKTKYSLESPEQVIDMLALMGDSSDNIPGVKGVGEVSAKDLIVNFKNVENILANLDKVKPKQRELIEASKEMLLLSRKLVTINTGAPITFDEEALLSKPFDDERLLKLLQELDFKTLIPKFVKNAQPAQAAKPVSNTPDLFGFAIADAENTAAVETYKTIANVTHQYFWIEDEDSLNKLCLVLEQAQMFCFDTETTGLDPHTDELVGISISVKAHEAYFIRIADDFEKAKTFLSPLKKAFENANITKIGHNLKFDILFLLRYNITVAGPLFDTMIAHYLLYPEQNHKMDTLSVKYLGYRPIPIEELIGRKGAAQKKMNQVEKGKLLDYAAEDADVTFQLYGVLKEEIDKSFAKELFYNVESKLLEVLINVEKAGFTLDSAYLTRYKKQLAEDIKQLEQEIYNLAGQVFNIASPKQLGEILFEKLAIPYEGKLTKTKQYSTGEEVLVQLEGKHPIIAKILEFRGLSKLLSTYVETLPDMINKYTGKIHTTFNQTLTVTGRLSSLNPNLQNIPIREERGREVRRAFTCSEGNILLSADYSQIELRIMAHMSQDDNMIDAFLHDADIHTATASKVFKIPVEQVTKEQRSKAKTANFGIIYGISAFGLAQRMNISRTEAMNLIQEYFKTFPGIKQYMTKMVLFAKEHGYVDTILQRRRYLPDIHSQNAVVRGMAERNAINTPIQGSAADVIKIAMINIFHKLQEEKLQSKMILQVHDELIFDVLPQELEKVRQIVVREMENAYPMAVPLKVDTGTGQNWLEAH
ncbi:MAG TPA: DNA polymerase I [Bacteroidales bacterium]|nr:DNA polymerase I [Bacteroidales bacterium]